MDAIPANGVDDILRSLDPLLHDQAPFPLAEIIRIGKFLLCGLQGLLQGIAEMKPPPVPAPETGLITTWDTESSCQKLRTSSRVWTTFPRMLRKPCFRRASCIRSLFRCRM